MVDVQFDEESYAAGSRKNRDTRPKGLTGLLFSLGVKDTKQANMVFLVVIVALGLVIVVMVLSGGSFRDGNGPPDSDMLPDYSIYP